MMSEGNGYDPAAPRMTFHDRTAAFRSGEATPRAYLEACLEVIEAREPEVRAWVCLNVEGARAAADASTARWQAGRPLSLVDGIPIGIKDLLETRDMPTEMGCEAFRGNFPKRDNSAVWALRQAGAVVLGKTVTTELGGAHPGPTRNPFRTTHSPGGSSSGSAAAVGAGMVPATIGSQVGGSIIRPSSYCGNVALKPTQGAIHRGERQATSQSTHGVHANSVEDMWQVAIVIAERAGGDPGRLGLLGPAECPAAVPPLALGIMETEGWPLLDDASRAAFEGVVDQLRRLGIRILTRADTPVISAFEEALVGVQAYGNAITAWENRWAIRGIVDNNPTGVSERTQALLASAEASNPEEQRARLARRERTRAAHALLAPLVDAMIAPASPGPAPVYVADEPGKPLPKSPTGNSVFNVPSSVLGAPVVTVPLTSVGGLPMGIQLMGQPHTDARITAYARHLVKAVTPVIA